MKGMTLPINMIVIIAIAVLVLVVVAGFFSGWFSSGTGTFKLEQEFNKACNALRIAYNCDPQQVGSITTQYKEYQGDPTIYSLYDLCVKKSFSDPVACARACGCNIP